VDHCKYTKFDVAEVYNYWYMYEVCKIHYLDTEKRKHCDVNYGICL